MLINELQNRLKTSLKSIKIFFGYVVKVFYFCTPKKTETRSQKSLKSSSIRNEKIITSKGYRASKLTIYSIISTSATLVDEHIGKRSLKVWEAIRNLNLEISQGKELKEVSFRAK